MAPAVMVIIAALVTTAVVITLAMSALKPNVASVKNVSQSLTASSDLKSAMDQDVLLILMLKLILQ